MSICIHKIENIFVLLNSFSRTKKKSLYFCENNDKWYISYYEKKNIWFIDHDFEHNSAMSCWKVIDDKVEIKDVMRIKVCKNVFKISVIKKEDI